MLALENKVMEVKNRLRIADLQLAFIRQRMAVQGLAPSDNDAKGFAERLRMKALIHSHPLTALEVEMITAFARKSAPSAAELILQEPITKLDVSEWSKFTAFEEDPEAISPEKDAASPGDQYIEEEGGTATATGGAAPT
jgi:hypothetical protein